MNKKNTYAYLKFLIVVMLCITAVEITNKITKTMVNISQYELEQEQEKTKQVKLRFMK